MKQRIILACSIINYGGVGKILNFVANCLLEDGREVIALSLRNEGRPTFLSEDVEFKTLKKKHFNNSILWRVEEVFNLRRTLKKFVPFTICTFGSEPSVMVRLATLGMTHIKVISAERSDPYTLPQMWKILSSWTYQHSDYCVFQLEKQRDFYNERVKKHSFVIPNAFISLDSFKCEREKRKVIISVGRFVYQKGYDVLIRAFSIVNAKYPDYTLELYGGGDDQIKYKNLIKDLGLTGKVKLFEYVRDVTSIIASCSIFVLSSRFEGIPNVLIEAMSAGVPTVSTDCTPGGPSFLTDNGRRGLLVAVDDVEAMATAICSIIESPALSSMLSKAGKEVCEMLDENKIARQWTGMFRTVTKIDNE